MTLLTTEIVQKYRRGEGLFSNLSHVNRASLSLTPSRFSILHDSSHISSLHPPAPWQPGQKNLIFPGAASAAALEWNMRRSSVNATRPNQPIIPMTHVTLCNTPNREEAGLAINKGHFFSAMRYILKRKKLSYEGNLSVPLTQNLLTLAIFQSHSSKCEYLYFSRTCIEKSLYTYCFGRSKSCLKKYFLNGHFKRQIWSLEKKHYQINLYKNTASGLRQAVFIKILLWQIYLNKRF